MNGIIPGYPNGSDLTILDCFYTYAHKDDDGKYNSDYITILYRDNTTGKKQHVVLHEPDYEFYRAKDSIQLDHNLLFIPKEDTVKVVTPFSQLTKTIAELTGNEDFYYNNINSGNRRSNEELHTLYNIFNSDTHIEDHYRFRFNKSYTNTICPISKAFFDIEVDTINAKGDFPELGECPINAVSYIFDNKIFSFILRNSENPQIQEFEDSINDDLFRELNDFIISNVGGIDKAKKFKVDNLSYEFRFYDEEIQLIHDLFLLINKQEPDFLLAWNMAFDIPYIMERLIELGYDPKDIMCHPSFRIEEKVAKYYIDTEHQALPEARGDKYTISGHTVYLDQLIHFASRRKGQAAFPDFKLDTAGSIIANVRKLDYSHITNRISLLPYKDFKVFIFYNIMDTIVQKCIEEKTNDIDFAFSKSIMNNTRYNKIHRQTVYLCNRACKVFDEEGYIIGNNPNRHTQSVPFAGAMVGDPTHNSDYSKVKGKNQIYNLVDNSDDYDFKSLYPSIDREFNMAPNTQIGKIYIDDKIHDLENVFNDEFYDRGGHYVSDLLSANYVEFCHRWFNYPNIKEWIKILRYYFGTIEAPTSRPLSNLFAVYNHSKLDPRAFEYESKDTRAFLYMPDEIDYSKYLNIIGGRSYGW